MYIDEERIQQSVLWIERDREIFVDYGEDWRLASLLDEDNH